MRNVCSRSLALLLLLAACEDEGSPADDLSPDDASTEDAASEPEGGSDDDASALDAEIDDSGAAMDADAADMDTGAHLDAAAGTDADAAPETGAADDGGMDAGEAGTDSSAGQDAHVDAADAGRDGEAADADAGPDAAAVCNDGNPATEDYSHPLLGCGVRTHANWVRFGLSGNGYLELDLLHDRLWSAPLMIANNLNVTYAQIETHCEALTLRGFADFRVPSIDDVRTLAGGCAETALGGSCPLSAAEPVCTAAQCGLSDSCESCIGGPLSTGPRAGYYCRAEVPDCLGVWTTTTCSDCAAGHRWFYGVINGNFYHSDSSTQAGRCVASAP